MKKKELLLLIELYRFLLRKDNHITVSIFLFIITPSFFLKEDVVNCYSNYLYLKIN